MIQYPLSPLFSDEKMQLLFGDDNWIATMVQVEVGLAQAQARIGLIPAAAAAQIAEKAQTFQLNKPAFQAALEKSGVPVAELARQLRQHVGGTAASFIHWGATTQDITDTATVLLIRDALDYLEALLAQTAVSLRDLVETHRHTLMAGRTHSQQALPTTFGLTAANWLAPLLRHQQRLSEFKKRVLVIQLGGAGGTLASFGTDGMAVQKALADQFELQTTPLPWHVQRDSFAELANWLSLVSGSLAKMAQDIILLAQTEIGEVRETADLSRGGSSAMPQKSNPMISETIIAAARTNAGLLANMHHILIAEMQRATHSMQLEWLNLPQMVILTAVCLNKSLFLSQNLLVKPDVMKANVASSNGLMMGESIRMALTDQLGATAAKKLVTAACQQAFAEQRHLVDVIQEKTDIPLDWDYFRDESNYVGAAQQMIDQLLKQMG